MKRTLVVGLAALSIGGCWGSASESPWPAEPADVDLGPAGEEELRNPTRATTPAATATTSARPARPTSEREPTP